MEANIADQFQLGAGWNVADPLGYATTTGTPTFSGNVCTMPNGSSFQLTPWNNAPLRLCRLLKYQV